MPILECWAVQRTAGTRLGVTQGLHVSFTRAVDVKQVDVEQVSNWWGCCWTVILIIFQFIINLRSNNTGTAKALKSSSWTFHGNTTTIYCKEIAKILPCREFFVWTPLPSGACQLTQSHSTNGPPGLDRLPDRLRRQWRRLVETFLKWYRDDLLYLVCTDK